MFMGLEYFFKKPSVKKSNLVCVPVLFIAGYIQDQSIIVLFFDAKTIGE